MPCSIFFCYPKGLLRLVIVSFHQGLLSEVEEIKRDWFSENNNLTTRTRNVSR